MHLAAERGHTSTVEFLADKFKASVFDRTKDGSTLMHIAANNGHPDTAMILFKKGVPLLMPNKVKLMPNKVNWRFCLNLNPYLLKCDFQKSQLCLEWSSRNSYCCYERSYSSYQKFVKER